MRDGALFHRLLDDGREVVVYPMTFGKGRLVVGVPEFDSYDDGWCYPRASTAIRAAQTWDGQGDPMDGWVRHLGTGRRRPDGDPAREHVSR